VSLARAEGIFVINFVTGRLEGRVLNPSIGKFTHSYFRNLAADFNIAGKGVQQYTIVAGEAALPAVGPASMAQGVIYVAEMRSGQVVCYAFPFNEANVMVPPVELTPLDRFFFAQQNL
jgi:hypothetical protein